MARARWFLFEHPVDAPVRDGKPQRGHMGAHLCTMLAHESKPNTLVVSPPICGDRGAVHVPDAQATGGFMLACIACLAISEIQP